VPADYKNYLVFDFEFTTHDSMYGRPRGFFQEVIEVGAVLLTLPEYKSEWRYQTFVKPVFFPRLSVACKNLTMINQDDVNEGVPLEEMLTKLAVPYQAGETGLVAWGNSDREVVENCCAKYKLPCPFDWSDYIDLAEEYKVFYQHERRISLKHAVEERQIERKGFYHLALDDAENTAFIVARMLQEGWLPGK
jgi:sporulation inhibitor KapD